MAAQTAPDHLLAQELSTEGANAENVRHGVRVPAFGQHGHGHHAANLLAEAAGVDARPDRFALPLAGVPVAVKDNVAVSGHPTRHGSAATPTAPARRDDELVKRLRRAGAVPARR